MKERVVSLLAVATALFTLLALPASAFAYSLSSITIDVKLDAHGNGLISDARTFTAESGTEHYLSFGHLGSSQISHVHVIHDGEHLTDDTPWNTDRSLEEKAGKFGTKTTDDGLEICFGIGSHGKHTSSISYRVSAMIKDLKDGNQALYWQFLNQNMDPVSHAHINVHLPDGGKHIDDARVWGFRYEDASEIADGALALDIHNFTEHDHAVMLAIFPEGTFEASDSLNFTTDELIARATEGSTFATGSIESDPPPSWLLALLIGSGIVGAGTIVTRIVKAARNARVERGDGTYWPSIPFCEDPRLLTELMGWHDGVFLPAVTLDLIRCGALSLSPSSVVDDDDDEATANSTMTLDMSKWPTKAASDSLLLDIFTRAFNGNTIRKVSDIHDYIDEHSDDVDSWIESVRTESRDYLASHLYTRTEEKRCIFSYTATVPTPTGELLKEHVNGFKRYLAHYADLTDDRDITTDLWDRYMVWATWLNINEDAHEEMESFVTERPEHSSILPFMIYNSHTHNVQTLFNNDSAAARHGLGGPASFTGGAGSFGGGTGGGTR